MKNWLIIKELLKNITWPLFLRIDVNSKPFISLLLDTINDFSNSNLHNWKYYFKSRHKENDLASGDVACIMCTWMEEKMVPFALESTKDFVSRYIVVDKDGETVPVIEACRDQWNLDMEIHIKPKMSLRESRAFALSRIDEPWILIQDGDEVFHTDGPNAISGLRRFMDRPHTVLMTPMNRLDGDIWHALSNIPQQPHHKFLYHNNGTLREPSFQWNHIIMDGWKIYLSTPYKFNCVIKSPKRMFLKTFWNEWCRYAENNLKYPNLEEYVKEELGINVETEAENWHKEYLKTLIPYDEKKWGYYPEVIRKYAQANELARVNP